MNMREVEQIVEAIGTIKSKTDRKRVINSLIQNEKLEIGDRFVISQLSSKLDGVDRKPLLTIDGQL